MVQESVIAGLVLLACGLPSSSIAGQDRPGALPRVFVADTSVQPGNPELVWLPRALTAPATLRGGMRLVYPDSLRRQGISGNVLLEFVVDTLGRVEPGVEVVKTAHPMLNAPARQMIMGARFQPARSHGRPVRSLMRMGLRVAPATTTAGTH